jgi:hypothetical protein
MDLWIRVQGCRYGILDCEGSHSAGLGVYGCAYTPRLALCKAGKTERQYKWRSNSIDFHRSTPLEKQQERSPDARMRTPDYKGGIEKARFEG